MGKNILMRHLLSRRRWRLLGVVLLFPVFVLVGCGLLPGRDAPEGVDLAESTQESANGQCGDYTAEDAVELWGGQVTTERGNWDLDAADTENFDPCAELSWILLTNGEAEPDYQVMLFRYGSFIQPAADHSFGSKPDVTRLADYSLKLSWRGDVATNATYEWVAGEGIKVSGVVPPARVAEEEPTKPEPTATKGPTAGSSPSPTAQTTPESRAARPMAVHRTEYSEYGYLITPSGNIMCEFDITGEGGCGVLSYMETNPYGEDEMWGARWWVYFGSRGAPEIDTKGDAPVAMFADEPGRVLEYGERAEYGAIICDSKSDGLTCWNTGTGHGATLSRSGFERVRVDQ